MENMLRIECYGSPTGCIFFYVLPRAMPWAVAILARWAIAEQMEFDKKLVVLRKKSMELEEKSMELEEKSMELEEKSNKSIQKSLVFSSKATYARSSLVGYRPEG